MKRSDLSDVASQRGAIGRCLREYGCFVPLLFLYLGLVLLLSKDVFVGDEGRYVQFARNLTQGFYSPSDPMQVSLFSGPGYPFVLMPFVCWGLPLLVAKVANACFLFAAIILIYRTLSLYVTHRQARWCALLLGVYPPFMSSLHYLLTEPFVVLLVSAFAFFMCHHAVAKKPLTRSLLGASITLAWLVLTKIIFGYVVALLLVVGVVSYALYRTAHVRSLLAVCCFSLFLCSPYLIYTHSLTGKVFHWGTSGGETIYWMSTPYAREFGDWRSAAELRECPETRKNHGDLFGELAKMTPVEADGELRSRAVRNIVESPGKYMLNIVANIGRMLFSYPYSYAEDRLTTYFWAIPNMFVFVTMMFCVYPTWVACKRVPGEIYTLLLFGCAAFGASSLVSAYARQFYVLLPLFAVWSAFVLFRILRVEIITENRSSGV